MMVQHSFVELDQGSEPSRIIPEFPSESAKVMASTANAETSQDPSLALDDPLFLASYPLHSQTSFV